MVGTNKYDRGSCCLWHGSALGESPQSQGVLHSPVAARADSAPVPGRRVKMDAGFWTGPPLRQLETSLPTLLGCSKRTGVVDNFPGGISGRKKVDRRGPLYTDSDLYKWMEAGGVRPSADDRPEPGGRSSTHSSTRSARPGNRRLPQHVLRGRSARPLRFSEMQRGTSCTVWATWLQAGSPSTAPMETGRPARWRHPVRRLPGIGFRASKRRC